MELADNYQYAEDPVTGTEVKNLYTDNVDASFNSDYQLKTILSRKTGKEHSHLPELKKKELSVKTL